MKIKTQMALALLVGAVLAGGGCRPAAPQQFPPETYSPEQTQGEVRVVLLEVAQLTVFNERWSADSPTNGVSAAPAFKVTCLIEVPETAGLASLVVNSKNSVEIAVDGKAVTDETAPGIVRGSSSVLMPFSESSVRSYLGQPKTAAGRAARVEETILRGIRVDSDHVDLSVHLNWKKRDMVFEFKDVPVN